MLQLLCQMPEKKQIIIITDDWIVESHISQFKMWTYVLILCQKVHIHVQYRYLQSRYPFILFLWIIFTVHNIPLIIITYIFVSTNLLIIYKINLTKICIGSVKIDKSEIEDAMIFHSYERGRNGIMIPEVFQSRTQNENSKRGIA